MEMDSRPYRAFVALFASALLVLAGLLASGILPLGAPDHPVGAMPVSSEATGNFDQLVVVLMENKNLDEVYGPAPYMTQLADQYAFSQGWSSITNPSQPNYIAIMGASTFGVSGDGNHPNLNHPTLVDLIETSGHTWNAIAEGSGSGCSINPDRGEDHFPFLTYTTITGNSARCANLHSGGPTDVVAALNAGTNFIWFTPNDGHNMRDNSVASGDAWIQSWVPGLLTAMAGKKAALIVMFDEAYTSPPHIYMSFSGPAAKLAYKSTASYSHYSLAKLLEDVWGGGSLGQGDVNAPSPLEFFNAGGPPVPDFSIAANPASVSFSAGQSATSTVSLTASGGFAGTVDLSAVSAPAGVSTSCSPASLQDNQTSTCTLGASGTGSYTVTVTGTNDSLVHTTSIGVTVTAPPTPDFSISATPASVSFVAGQSATSTISVQLSEGFTGTVALTPASSPAGVTASCFPSSISGTQVSTCMLNATAPGSYTVVVTGTSGTLSHATSILVGVTGAGPTARFTFAPSAPVANHSVLFDASSSSDADPNAILGARWDWGGDGRWDTPWSYSLTASHVFTTAGTYAVTLQVLDAYGLVDTTSRSVTVLRPDKIAPQVTILSPPDGAIVGPEDVTVERTASDNVAIVELRTDNATAIPTAGTTQWSGTIPLKAGTNQIYVRATDTSGNENVVEITVIAEQRPAGLAGIVDPMIPVLLVFASVGALVGAHAFVAGRSRTRRAGPKKKETVVVQPPKSRDPSIPAGKGLVKR